MKKLQSTVRRAITDFNLIEDGDVIAVGVSGGKDSLALLSVLCAMRIYLPQKFTLKAIMLDLGFDGFDPTPFIKYCEELNVECIVKKTDIAQVVFNIRKESNPCSLCAKMRRGALNELAKEQGCNKVALGHHCDDAIETFFMSLLYEGRLNCFDAKCYLDRTDITVIRPFIYTDEKDIENFANSKKLPIVKNPCPADGFTKRQYAKDLITMLEKENKDAKQHITKAITDGLLLKNIQKP